MALSLCTEINIQLLDGWCSSVGVCSFVCPFWCVHLVDRVQGSAVVVEVVAVDRKSGTQLDKHVSHAAVAAPVLQSGFQVDQEQPAEER